MQTKRPLLLALSLLSGCAATSAGGAAPAFAPGGASGPFGAYLVGRYAADSNQPDAAATALLAALDHAPNDPALLTQTFTACLIADRPEAAVLAQRLPNYPLAGLLLGTEAAIAGNWQTAQRHFAAPAGPGLATLLQPLLVAWTQQAQADIDGALATLRPQLSGPLAGLYALHAALIADLGNRFADAQQLYALAASRLGGPDLRLATILANWQWRQGHADDASAVLKAATVNATTLAIVIPGAQAELATRPIRQASDGIAEVYLALAAELRQQNGDEAALALLQLALDLRPGLTPARLLMADIQDAGKHPSVALRTLAPIPNQDPLAPLARLRRAALLSELGNDTLALAGLRQLAQALPDRPEPLAAIADLQRQRHQLDEAIGSYGQAIARMPVNAAPRWPLYYARAVSEQQAHRWPQAEADLEQALSLAPDQPELLNFLGFAWADQGRNLPRAHLMLSRAATLRPNDGAIIDSLGWVLLREGNVADAVRSLEHAVQIEPEDPEINGHLGDAYWAAGRKLQARYQWQLALALKPDPGAVPKLQAKLAEAERATELGPTLR